MDWIHKKKLTIQFRKSLIWDATAGIPAARKGVMQWQRNENTKFHENTNFCENSLFEFVVMNIIRCSYKIEFVTLRKTHVLLLCFFLNDLLPQLDSPFPYIAGKARAAAALRESGRCPNPQKITTAAVATWTWRMFFLPKKGSSFLDMSCHVSRCFIIHFQYLFCSSIPSKKWLVSAFAFFQLIAGEKEKQSRRTLLLIL